MKTLLTQTVPTEDVLKSVHGVAQVAALDGDESIYLLGEVAEIKRRK